MNKTFCFLVLGLIVACFILYWPNPNMGFVLDDHYTVEQNPVIKNPSMYPRIATSGFFDAAGQAPESKLNYYRPLTTASFAVDYALWGNDAFGYRLVNIGLHAFNSVLVFVLLFALVRNAPLAIMAALIFCILPSNEWVVRYITGRGDLLQSFFSLLCLIGVVRYWEQLKRPWLYMALVCFVLAILSREAAVLNVLFIFLAGFYMSHDFKKTLRLTGPFLVLAVGYGVARAQFFPVVGQGAMFSPHGMVEAAGLVLHWWTPALVLGVMPDARVIAAVLALCGVALLVVMLLRSRQQGLVYDGPLAALGIWWIAAGLLPLAIAGRIVDRLGPVLSEHFLYFASVGFAFLCAFILQRMKNTSARKVLIVIMVVYCVKIGMVNGYFWSSELMLLRHVQALEEKEGTVAYEQIVMRFDDDESAVIGLINNAPSFSKRSVWLKRLGNIYHRRSDYPKAIAALQEAIATDGQNIDAINELAVCYLETLDTTRGIALLDQSIQVQPHQVDAWRIKGIALYRWGRFPEVVAPLNQALLVDPQAKEPLLYLMMTYYFLHDERSYLETVNRLNWRVCDQRELLSFAAIEFFSHDYFSESDRIFSQSSHLWANDPGMQRIWHEARRRAGLPK